MDYKKVLVNFLPIILVFLLVTYTREFATFSHTILGKLFAIIIIIFYVKMDKLAGLFVCILIIFYYQTDYVESFNNMLNKYEAFENTVTKVAASVSTAPVAHVHNVEDEYSRSLETVDRAYPLSETNQQLILYDKSKEEFRKTYCSKGHLIHYGQVVKNEMAEHVYPEIKIADDFHKCNVCDHHRLPIERKAEA